MDFVFENMVAINFVNLDNARACEVLEARNAVGEFMLTHRKISKAEHFRFIDSLRGNKNSAYFAVYEKYKIAESRLDSANKINPSLQEKAQNLLGVICFNSLDLANKNAFFGIYSARGENNGAKLLQILRFIAFEGLNLHILYAKVLHTNARAIRFYEKNGFVRCGRLFEAVKRGVEFIDLEIWALKNNAK